MFTLWVPVLQTGAFTITLPAVINNLLSDNNSLPCSLILSFFSLLFLSACLYGQMLFFVLKCGEGSACFPLPYKIVNVLGINPGSTVRGLNPCDRLERPPSVSVRITAVLVLGPGFEPGSPVLQTGAFTRLAYQACVLPVSF